jgi:MFS family permease
VSEDASVIKAIESFSLHAGGLLINRLILKMAFGFIDVFVPILLYQLFGVSVLGVYILVALVVILLTPISAALLSKFGIRSLIAVSIPFASVAVWALSLNDISPSTAGFLFAILFGTHHALYWVPYHVDFVRSLSRGHQGAVLGWYEDLLELVTIATPVIGGVLIVLTGFSDTLLFISLLCLMSLFPIYYVKDMYETFEWGYLETFARLFSHKNRHILVGYAADGAQVAAATVLWPIFLFELLGGRYVVVGIVTTFALLGMLVLNLTIGYLIDKFGPDRLVRWGIVLSLTGWVLKAFVGNPFEVFMVDTYHKFGDAVMRLSRNVTGYNSAAESGHYIDEYTTLSEIAYQMGKVVMLVLAGALLVYVGIRGVFVVTGLISIFLIVFGKHIAFSHRR